MRAAWARGQGPALAAAIPGHAGRSSTVADIGTHAYHMLHHVTGRESGCAEGPISTCGAPQALEDTAFVSAAVRGRCRAHAHAVKAGPRPVLRLPVPHSGAPGRAVLGPGISRGPAPTRPLTGPERTCGKGRAPASVPRPPGSCICPEAGEGLTDAGPISIRHWPSQSGQQPPGQPPNLAGPRPVGPDEGLRACAFVQPAADSHAGARMDRLGLRRNMTSRP